MFLPSSSLRDLCNIFKGTCSSIAFSRERISIYLTTSTSFLLFNKAGVGPYAFFADFCCFWLMLRDPCSDNLLLGSLMTLFISLFGSGLSAMIGLLSFFCLIINSIINDRNSDSYFSYGLHLLSE